MKAAGEVEDGKNEFSQLMNLLRLLQQAQQTKVQQQQQQQSPSTQPQQQVVPTADTKLPNIQPNTVDAPRSLSPAELQQQQLQIQLLQQHLLKQQQNASSSNGRIYIIFNSVQVINLFHDSLPF